MMSFNKEQLSRIDLAIRGMVEWHRKFTEILSRNVYNYTHPPELEECYLLISSLQNKFAPDAEIKNIDLNLPELCFLKRALISHRRKQAQIIEGNREKTIHPDVISGYDSQIKELDALIDQDFLREITPMDLPCEAAYVPIESLEEYNQAPLPEREYDEKFHILQAPTLFLKDLRYYRTKCEMRGTGLIVAYIDIDKFGAFNADYTETEVDRLVLPRFMRLLESYTYHHGFAYRFGGDEYTLLIPNIPYDLGKGFLDGMRKEISEMEYPGIDRKITVSIGFCCVSPGSHLTDRETLKMANNAKAYAKAKGRNCLATYKDSRFNLDSLFVP